MEEKSMNEFDGIGQEGYFGLNDGYLDIGDNFSSEFTGA